ncbi:MAG: hypothetical protein NTW86_01225, partial [Candidatus Sumerlaeota bacterium]|nr:hypothetical protein [Candidatus Sumerlaeota bacterium]
MSSFVSEPEAKSIVEALEAGRTPEGFERVLRRAEMTDVEGGWANLGRLFHLIYAAQFRFLLPDLLSALRRSADPDRALRNWIAFLNRVFDAYGFAQRLAGTPDLLEFLTRLFGFSQFLADLLARNPEYLDWLRAPHVLERPKSLASYVEEAWNAVEVFEDPEHQRAALCRYQRKELLRIGVRDMQGYGNVAERTAELSDLAEAIVNVALSLVYARLAKRHGEPLAEDAPNARSQFGILAMGKFGGRELNFSSDIDVIFLYSDEGSTQGVGESRQARIANHAFFTRLGEDLAQHLSGHGPEGFLYRVDVRLRPDGESGALVRSLVGFETYYLTQARLWERFAFLKARLVTPTEGRFSEAVRALCEHFVYGQPLGPEILPELADVKRRIDRQVEERGVAGREVKRGVGGIREVEFIVGSLQLLHGHGRKDLRARSTLAALQAIERLGLLSADECGALTNAYVFFRDVEHRLQMLNLRQTHTLPKDSAQLRMLARRMDLESDGAKDPGRRFREQYARHARAVHRIFERMFGAAAADEPRREGVHVLLDRQASPDERFHVLQGYRFTDPAILEAFRSLAFGHREIYLSAAGQEFFEAILPRLLEECAKVPLPEQAVRFFDSFLLRLKGIAATYAFIAEHPIVLSILLGVFGASEALARILLARPEFLDMIVDAETLHTVPQAAALRARVADLAALQARIGGFQADLCRFKDLEFFVAGVRDLQRLVSSKQTAATLSDIAEA